MRLHHLTLQAFGPFAGTERIDFDRLSAGGLFLIHGSTGAGKTSVLDAVCFALYGRVPGARHNDRSPKSDHAPQDRAPEVTLEFTCRGRRVHIERRPRWERPKKRGTGTKVENTKVVVTELVDGTWTGVTTRMDEAGQFIGDLIGLTLDQFCQVAMLPQGDFARFLRARSDERRQSLERIFHTGVFRDVEEWFKTHANQLRREVESAEARVHETAGRISEVARTPAPRMPEDLSPWATELACVTAATARDADRVVADLVEAREHARRAWERGRSVLERHERLSAARRRHQELSEFAEERRHIDVRLAAAERAMVVLPFLNARDHRRTRRDKAEVAVAEQLSLVRGLQGVDVSELTEEVDPQKVLRALEQERRDELARLELLRADAERRRTLGHTVGGLDQHLQELAHELTGVREQLTALPARVESLTDELHEVRGKASRVEAAEAALAVARKRWEAAREGERLAAELSTAEEHRSAAVDTAQNTRENALELRERRITQMAAELAEGLVDGDPCTVCGSLEHPSPALPSTEGLVSAQEERRAQAAADAAATRRTEAESTVVALGERRAAATERAEGRSVTTAHQEVEEHTAALSEARTAAEQVSRLEGTLDQLTTDLQHVRAAEGELLRKQAEAGTEREGAVAEYERLTALVDSARGDDAGIEERARRLGAEAELLRAAAEALAERDRAAEELRAAEVEADWCLAELDLSGRSTDPPPGATEAEVHAATLDEREREALREQARAHDDELATLHATLADPELTGAGPVPDLAALQETAERAEELADHAVAWRSMVEERARRLSVLREELTDRLAGSEPVLRRYAIAEGMRGLTAGTSGDNTDNVRLSAYVLASRLEQVVAAANDRLLSMSDGRYELRYTVDKAAGDGRARSAGGLGMRVVDAWTGAERDPATLSGGETFFSSLALALGLGDVAGAEAGGADIDTLFVDEGFGTLDEDTLEEVLEVLDRLRDGGRAVGVVSHVADLRQRVTTRLRVVKSSSGSRVEHVEGTTALP